MQFRMRKTDNLQPNMMSMIDFIMLLLVFFMVTARFKGTEADILSLPYARNAEEVKNDEKLSRFVVNIGFEDAKAKSGRIFFKVQGVIFDPLSTNDMEGKRKSLLVDIKAFRRQNREGEIVVRVDRDIEYKYVRILQRVLNDALGAESGKEPQVRFSVDVNPPGASG